MTTTPNHTAPETRTLDVAASEVRAAVEPDGRKVVRGVVLRYGSLSNVLRDAKGRPFRERFTAGAFARALVTADIRLLVNHNRDLIFGRSTNKSLRLVDGPDALRFECDWPDTPLAAHYHWAVDNRVIDGVSFRFYKLADSWSGAGEATVRTVTEADIDDVSVVVYPSYNDSTAETGFAAGDVVTRSLDDHRHSPAGRDPWLDSAAVRLRLAAHAAER